MRGSRPARALPVFLAAVGLALAVGGCSGSGRATLVLYSGQHVQLTNALASAFERKTGISVEVRTNDGIVLAQQLLHEGRGSPADVYLTENSPEMVLLSEHGLLRSLPASILDQVPAQDRASRRDWVGMAARVSSLAYNTAAIAQSRLPASIIELAQPGWAGKIAVAPTDSDFVPVVAAVIATYGEARASQWLTGLKRNAVTYQDIEAVLNAVDHGTVATGLINQYYWYRLRLELGSSGMHSAIHYFSSGDPGAIENIAGAAVVAASGHPQAAERFVAFLVSAKGQEILAAGDDYEYPIRPGIAPNPVLPPLAGLRSTVLGAARLGDDQAAARLIQRVGFLGS